jgi:anti-sigma regulatory factor (Ser/Thr protein kinase)
MVSTATLSDQADVPANSRVCAVYGRGQLDMVLELTAEQLGSVRKIVRSTLELWDVDENTTRRALLVAHELLANVVLHTPADLEGRHPATLLLQQVPGGLSVIVSDRSPTYPAVVSHSASDESGRGWWLVQALADDLSVSPTKNGKDVWAQLDNRTSGCGDDRGRDSNGDSPFS